MTTTVPDGSLNTWVAERDASDTERVEVAIFGDSLTWGITGAGAQPYSWVNFLRALSIEAGYGDGGKGFAGRSGGDTDADIDYSDLPGEVAIVLSQDGFDDAFANQADITAGQGTYWSLTPATTQDDTDGDTITFQGTGVAFRLMYQRAFQTTGRMGISIDGGAETWLDPVQTASPTPNGLRTIDTYYVEGLDDDLHTVRVRNVGGCAGGAVTLDTGGGATGVGTLPAGSYYYRIAGVSNGGTTAASNVAGPFATNGSQGVQLYFANSFYPAYNVYRSTTLGGTYELVATWTNTLGNNQGVAQMYFDAGATAGVETAPTVDTTEGVNSAASKVFSLFPCFMRSTGIVYNKFAVGGIAMSQVWNAATGTASVADAWQNALGLTSGNAEDTHPTAPRTRLAIFHYGYNDMSLMAGTLNLPSITVAVNLFIDAARAAGADPLVCVGDLQVHPNWDDYGQDIVDELMAVCAAESVAFVDLMTPLYPVEDMLTNGYLAVPGDPHLTKLAYQLQAQYLWEEVLTTDATFPLPPDTPVFTEQPDNPSPEGGDVTFAFTSGGATSFECSLDGAGYASCTSPQSYSDLAIGSHTFAVRGVNLGGTSAAASVTWRVAGPPPTPSAGTGAALLMVA